MPPRIRVPLPSPSRSATSSVPPNFQSRTYSSLSHERKGEPHLIGLITARNSFLAQRKLRRAPALGTFNFHRALVDIQMITGPSATILCAPAEHHSTHARRLACEPSCH